MQDTIDSIMAGGVINPILVRPAEDGKFEVVSGHRRFRASELAGKADIKAIVRKMDDDTAVITMVDSNLQRENILPSERAFSYRMKMEALTHQGQPLPKRFRSPSRLRQQPEKKRRQWLRKCGIRVMWCWMPITSSAQSSAVMTGRKLRRTSPLRCCSWSPDSMPG